jgi:uncharacterized protein involved in exopolysaccharide biosynthesis/Mrp family chromosome partitioning ATPase
MPTTNLTRVTPRDVARIFFRHWRMMALIFCSVVVLALVGIALYPRSYASEAKLLIRVGRESVALDPTATTGETIMLQKSQEDEVNSALNILTSRAILERIVKQVGAERILDDLPSGRQSASDADTKSGGIGKWISRQLVALGLSDPGTEVDQAVRRLETKCAVSAPKQSTVITVSYKAASPELAHDVVEAWTNIFLEEHSRLSQTEGSLKFFSEQVDKLYNDLSAAEKELRDRKNEYQLTTSGNRLSILEKSREAMRQKVYDLKLLETDLMSRYTDLYPPLKEVRRQREMAERMLMETPVATEQPEDSASLNRGGPVQAKVYPVSNHVVENSDSPQSKFEVEVQTLNDQEYELARLEREVSLLDAKYAMHVKKLEEARVNDALGRERITNVKIAQPATLVYKPVSPKKMLLMVAALVVAFIGSVGSAFTVESLDQTLRTTDQVEAQLGLPVLASLPYRKHHGSPSVSLAVASANGQSALLNGSHRYSSYRDLVTSLRSNGGNGERQAKTIGVVGCGASKLRSRVAGNIAIEAASMGTEPVLLIDADTRGRRVSKRFHLNGASGWRDVLAGTAVAESCVKRAGSGKLAVMGPGSTNDSVPPAGDLEGSSLGQLDALKSDYGLVVLDLPPASGLDGAPAFDAWIDEAVLVVEAEHTRVQAAQRAKDVLNLAGVHVTGVVLANRREYIPHWLYQRL